MIQSVQMENDAACKRLILIYGDLFDVDTINRIISEYEYINTGRGLKILYRTERCGYPCLSGYYDVEGKRIVAYDEYCRWESYERDRLKPFYIPCPVLEQNGISSQQVQEFNRDSLQNSLGVYLLDGKSIDEQRAGNRLYWQG